MRTILTLAQNTFREAIRDRILYGILAFGLIFVLLALFMARLALGDMVMVRSFGLAGIYIFGLIAAVFLGSSIIYKEVERRTLYFILSKPVSRREVVVGKFLGLFAAITLTVLLMAIIYLAVIFAAGGGWDWLGLLAVAFELLEMALLTALLIFFSALVAPLLATLCAVVLIFVGHLLPTVLANSDQSGGATAGLVRFFYYLLPNLEKFNIRNLVVHQVALPGAEIFWSAVYALVYILILLILADVCLEKKEL